jgi:hypothetical protein
MLKRWRNLPRAGVGLLGLALVLMLTVSADAESGRDGMRRLGGSQQSATMWGVPQGVDPASSPAVVTPPSVQEFSAAGSTNINFNANEATDCGAVGLTCNAGDTCQCVKAVGMITDGVGPLPIVAPNVTFLLNVDISHSYNNGNNVGKSCFFATGVFDAAANDGSIMKLITSGAACNGIGGGVALYSGGFSIVGSTGGFVNAIGGGMLGFGGNFNNGIGVFDIKGAGTNLN